MAEQTSNSRLENLFENLKNDANLASKLDLLEEISNKSYKRKNLSPIKTKKVIIISDGSSKPKDHPPQTGSPDELGHDYGTINAGASCSKEVINNDSVEECLEESEDELSPLEKIICSDQTEKSQSDSDDSEDDFNILGKPSSPNWSPSEKALKFYLNVADLELSKEVIQDLQEEFKSSAELDKHFCPPRFPPTFWDLVQNSTSDSFKLKSLFKCQEKLYLALKPLLNCLENCSENQKDDLTKAIQLIASSNLTLNRFRRVTIAPHLKNDVRKQLFSLPVHHDSFFGSEFSKSSDSILKENSNLEKIIKKPAQNFNNNSNNNNYNKRQNRPNFQNFNNQNSNPSNPRFFRGKSRGRPFRSRGNRGSFRRQNQDFHQQSKFSNPYPNHPNSS